MSEGKGAGDCKGPEDLRLAGQTVLPGQNKDLLPPISESYSGSPLHLPFRVVRAKAEGPVVLVTGAVHGDELNGTGVVRRLIQTPPFELLAGTLILFPVVNVLGFERHSRYMPDRRDLNRCFPGSASGSLASRFAHTFFRQIVRHADFCLDFHTAAVRRTNFPNVRADLEHPEVRRLALSFGCSLVLDHPGIEKSLRRTATAAGCPTIILEAGEVWKVEPAVVELGLRGVRNVLIELGMVDGAPAGPPYQIIIQRSDWVRADHGGMLDFHRGPGQVAEKGQAIATVSTLLGQERGVIRAPVDGVILALSTMPAVKPGDPVCHLARPPEGIEPVRTALAELPEGSLHRRLLDDLASNLSVSEPQPVQRARGLDPQQN